jgi:hypothetical protein
MRWFSFSALVAASAFAFAGCSLGGEQAGQTHVADPAAVVAVLPARPGLTSTGPVTTLDAAGFTRALIGHPDDTLTQTLSSGGFQRGASRTWSGANGASLTAVVGLWNDGDPAQTLGGDAASAVVPGGASWMPSEFSGSQGSRSATARALNVVDGQVSLFLRATGPVNDATVLRQMSLMKQAEAGRDRRGTGSNG